MMVPRFAVVGMLVMWVSFTTHERTSENPLVIIKSDGSSEAYDREKLFRGLLIACANDRFRREDLATYR